MTELPSSWAWTTVGEVADLVDGPFGSNLKTSHYVDRGPRVVRLQNIGDGFFRDERAHITPQHFDRLEKHAVRADDVVVASLGEEAPKACLIPAWLGPALVKADCIRLRPRAAVEPRYVMWMLNSPPIRRQAANKIKGIGRPRLGLGGIRSLALPLPPLAEQRRIVTAIEEQLSRLDTAVSELHSAAARLTRMKLLILVAAFRNLEETIALQDVAEVRLGRQRSPKNHSGPTMRPYVRAANVTWRGLRLDDVKEMNFSPAEASTYELQPGDVLLAEASGSASEVGKPVVWNGEIAGCCFQNTVIRVRSQSFNPDYLRLVFLQSALLGQFAQAAPGVGIHHLGSSRLSKWPVPVCDDERQARLVEQVERQFTLVDALAGRSQGVFARGQTLRRAILASAFRGELAAQDPDDEPASVLLERIAAERASSPKAARKLRERTRA